MNILAARPAGPGRTSHAQRGPVGATPMQFEEAVT